MTNEVVLENLMERTINRNSLRYSVGQTMFCPSCQTCMDVTRAVEITAYRRGNVPAAVRVCCASCYDANLAPKLETLRAKYAATGHTIAVLDGRILFAPEINPAPPTPNPVHKCDVVIGGDYVTHQGVRVTVLRLKEDFWTHRMHWVCRSHKTGREIIIKSAARFARKV